MKKLVYLIVVIVALGLIIAGCLPTVPPTGQDELGTLPNKGIGDPGEVWNQTTNIQYFAIQAAIDATSPGDTITVAAGTYNERVVINKPLTLQGENRDTTVIDGTGMTADGIPTYGNNGILINPGSAYHMQDVDITISGFTVQNFAVIGAGGGAGIYADPTYQYSNITISDVIAKDNGLSGLYLPYVLNSHFSNIVVDNNDQIDNGQGYGIWVSVWSSGNTFTDITATNHDSIGIYVMQSHDNIFTSVNCTGNTIGIYFYSSGSNTVENSSINNNNNKGVRCWSGSNNQIHFSNIEGNEAFGVDSLFALDATNNWWGHASGPSGEGGRINPAGKPIGKGDAVSENVEWDPWLPQPINLTPHDPVPPGLK